MYERILGVPYYILFDRYTDELRAFQLAGNQYQEVVLAEPRVWVPELKLGLGLWSGEYRGIPRLWLRWYDEQGEWVLTEAEQERQRAESNARAIQALTEDLVTFKLVVEQDRSGLEFFNNC